MESVECSGSMNFVGRVGLAAPVQASRADRCDRLVDVIGRPARSISGSTNPIRRSRCTARGRQGRPRAGPEARRRRRGRRRWPGQPGAAGRAAEEERAQQDGGVVQGRPESGSLKTRIIIGSEIPRTPSVVPTPGRGACVRPPSRQDDDEHGLPSSDGWKLRSRSRSSASTRAPRRRGRTRSEQPVETAYSGHGHVGQTSGRRPRRSPAGSRRRRRRSPGPRLVVGVAGNLVPVTGTRTQCP